MSNDLHIYLHFSGEQELLNKILSNTNLILNKEVAMSKEMDDLEAQVTQNTSVVSSALTLIQGFAAQLAAAGNDPTKLNALKTALQQSDDALAAAVAANTPSAPGGSPTP